MNEVDVLDKVNRLSLPATILIASIVLGGFYYASQASKQGSIERQQEAERLADKNREDQLFITKQKESCLNIYKVEINKWNNVNGWRYDEAKDNCYIQYRESIKKTAQQCDVEYKNEEGDVSPLFFMDWLLCKDGLFEKVF